jgi:hypothetical protein
MTGDGEGRQEKGGGRRETGKWRPKTGKWRLETVIEALYSRPEGGSCPQIANL